MRTSPCYRVAVSGLARDAGTGVVADAHLDLQAIDIGKRFGVADNDVTQDVIAAVRRLAA